MNKNKSRTKIDFGFFYWGEYIKNKNRMNASDRVDNLTSCMFAFLAHNNVSFQHYIIRKSKKTYKLTGNGEQYSEKVKDCVTDLIEYLDTKGILDKKDNCYLSHPYFKTMISKIDKSTIVFSFETLKKCNCSDSDCDSDSDSDSDSEDPEQNNQGQLAKADKEDD